MQLEDWASVFPSEFSPQTKKSYMLFNKKVHILDFTFSVNTKNKTFNA